MEDTLVKRNTAILAKEKGFTCYTWDCAWMYLDGNCQTMTYNEKTCVLMPTQALLQKWLREVHNIQVYAYSHTKKNDKWGDYIVALNSNSLNDAWDEEFQTYEEALELGLHEALDRI